MLYLRKLIALHEIAEILLKVSLNTHQSILFFEETRVPGENLRPAASKCKIKDDIQTHKF
jgi:hypothetical protein